jgi:hypothetical protein
VYGTVKNLSVGSYCKAKRRNTCFKTEAHRREHLLFQKFGPNTGLTFASWMAFAIPVMMLNLGKLEVIFLNL